MNLVLRYILETGACLVLFYAGYWLFLKKETYFLLNRVYLLASLLLSFLIPVFHVPSPFLTFQVSPAPIAGETAATFPARSAGFADAVLMIYAAGVLMFLARFIVQVTKLFLVVKKSESRNLGGARIVSVDREFAPFSFLKYIFINDREFSPGNLRHILAHEEAHIRQGHSLDILLAELATVAQWFNPIVRPYKRSIQETHEFLADREVIAQGFNSARYQLVMLEQQVGTRLLGLSHSFKQSQIKRRIVMMSQTRSKGAAKLKVLVLMPLAALLVLALAQPRPIVAADSALVSAAQDKTDQSLDEAKKKEMLVKAEESLARLKEKEAKLKKVMETTTDPEKQKELEKNLKVILEMQKKTEAFIADPTLPPPPPLPPPAPPVTADLKLLKEKELDIKKALATEKDPAKIAELKHDLQVALVKEANPEAQVHFAKEIHAPAAPAPAAPDSMADLKMLEEKALKIKEKLKAATDAEEQAKLKAMLEEIQQKQHAIQDAHNRGIAPAPPAPPAPPARTFENYNQMLSDLQAKEKEVRAELSNTSDPEKTAELEDILKKIAMKQEQVKKEMAKLKSVSEEK